MKMMRWQAENTGQLPVEEWNQERLLSKQLSENLLKKQVFMLMKLDGH